MDYFSITGIPQGMIESRALLVSHSLRPVVLQLIHGLVGSGHFDFTLTLLCPWSLLDWPRCRQDVELFIQFDR